MSESAVTRLKYGYRFKNRWLVAGICLFDNLLTLLPRRSSVLPSAPRSILLMKPDHLGDLVMLTAVLPLLAEHYPDAAIDILCGPWGGAVLENNPSIRRLIPFHHILYDRRKTSSGRKLLDFWKSIMHALKVMREERYDLCLNLRDAGGDLILLARLGGCRHIVGHGTGGFRTLLDEEVVWHEGRHEVEHYLEVLGSLGIVAGLADLHCQLYPQPADGELVSRLLTEVVGGESFVVIHPGSGDRRKLRPAAAWAQLIDGLDASLQVVVTGSGEEEQHLFAEIAALSTRKPLSLVGALSVTQLYLLLQRAVHVYTLDSLAAHLGAAAGAATTVFWSVTNDPCQWRPLGEEIVVLDSRSGQPVNWQCLD